MPTPKLSAFKRAPLHHPKNLKTLEVNEGAGSQGLKVYEHYARNSNKLWRGARQTRVTTSDPMGRRPYTQVSNLPGGLTPAGKKVRNYTAGGAAVAAYGGLAYSDYKRAQPKKPKPEALAKSVWGITHGDDVSKHYLGRHGEEHHHDRSQHRTLRHEKKKYKRYANSASSNAFHTGATKAKNSGSDTWYDVGETVHSLIGGDPYKYRQTAGYRPSEKAGYQSQEEWEQSKAGRSARRKQGRAKANWNPRWGERHGYKRKDVRKNHEAVQKAFSFRALGAAKKAVAPEQSAGVKRGLAMVNNPKVGNVSRVGSQKFSAPTPRLGVQKGFTPILSNAGKGVGLSPVTRAMRIGQVGGQAQKAGARAQFGASQFGAAASRIGARRAQGASRFGGPSSQQFAPVGQKIAGQRAAGAKRFGQTQGGGAVPRGAGAAAHSAASGLRTPTPPKVPNALNANKKKIAIGAGVAGAGGVGYGVSKSYEEIGMGVSVWGVEHGPDSISKDLNGQQSLKQQGAAFAKPGARRRAGKVAGREAALFSPRGTNRKENWKQYGRSAGRGAAYGGGAGAAIGALATRGSRVGTLAGAAAGADLGMIGGSLHAQYKIADRAQGKAYREGAKSGDIKTGLRRDQITAFNGYRHNS